MVKIAAKILSCIWFFKGKKVRRDKRNRLISWMYARSIRRTAKSVGSYISVFAPTSVTKTTTIGNHCGFGGVDIFGAGEVTIGDNTYISAHTTIYSHNHNYLSGEYLPFGFDWIIKPVRIDECVWIGSHCIILPGTHIGEGAIIQAGSVVHGEIPPLSIAGGNPAKVFAHRDEEHYWRLKAAKKFVVS